MTLAVEILLASFCLVLLIYLLQIFRYSGPITLIGANDKPFTFLKAKEKKLYYIPNLLYGITASINTLAAFTKNKRRAELEREEMKGADGGSFFLDWYSKNNSEFPSDTPIIMFVHGISGGSYEPYLQKCAFRLVNNYHWRCCCYLYRGCCRTPLTTPRTYNGGYTEDIHIAIKELSQRYPGAPIALVGYSLGGNLVAKYLGELNSEHTPICKYQHVVDHEDVPAAVKCAVTIGNPCNLLKSNAKISLKNNLFFGKGLMRYAEKHKDQLQKLPSYVQLQEYLAKNPKDTRLFLFDDSITCPIFHYKDHIEFYTDASCSLYLDGVRVPLLMIQNENDPASTYEVFSESIKAIEQNPNIAAAVIPGGGHLGAFYPTTTKRAIDEDLVVLMLKEYLKPSTKQD